MIIYKRFGVVHIPPTNTDPLQNNTLEQERRRMDYEAFRAMQQQQALHRDPARPVQRRSAPPAPVSGRRPMTASPGIPSALARLGRLSGRDRLLLAEALLALASARFALRGHKQQSMVSTSPSKKVPKKKSDTH